jgi:hypothetical protein
MKLTRILFFACGLLVLTGSWSRADAAIGQLWAKHEGSASYYEEMDHYVAVVSDAQGNVFTAGTAQDTVADSLCYVTTKYNQWGRIVWRSFDRYPQFYPYLDTPPPTPQLVLDTSGNLYLGETEQIIYGGAPNPLHWIRVIKFNGSNGSKLWNQAYLFGGPMGYYHDSYLSGMVYDSVYRNLFLASTEYWWHSDSSYSNYDLGIEKINPNDGSAVWDSAYAQSRVMTANDIATGICLSAITRNPVITGYCQSRNSVGGIFYNWVTASFDRTSGARLWARPWRRDSVADDEMPWAITSDSTGIYVAGGIYQDNESQYGWALLKLQLGGSIVNADTDYTNENVYYDNWLTSVKTTVGTSGRAYAAGWVDRDATNSLDWLVIGDTSGPRQTSLLRHLWRTTKDDGLQNDDQAAAVVLDNQDRPWVMGYLDRDSVYDWGVSRFAADGSSSPNLSYHRNDNWDDAATPTALAVRDTNHIYVGGFTLNDSSDENHTVVRFGANIPSAALDSFRDSTFAWRDTVDSGATVRVNAFYHNTGYSLAMPKIKASLSPFYADSSVDTVGAPPESSRAVLMTHRWTAGARGPGVMKCTLAMAGDTSPANNLRTRNVFVRVGDVAPDSLGVADTVDEGVAFTPAARVHNFGNTSATFPIAFRVGDTIKTFTVNALPPDSTRRVTFPAFTMPRGKYRVRTYTQLSYDLRRSNDTLNRSDSIFVRYRDIACRSILAPVGSYVESVSVTPSATFKNMGNVTTTFRVDFVIPPPSDQAQLPVFGVQPLFPDLLPRSLAPLLPAPQFSPKLFSSTPQLAPVLSGSAKNPGTLKSVVRSPQSSIPASPQPPAFSSRLALLLPHSLAPYSAVRTPRSALGTDGTYHDSILSITLAAGDSSIRSFTSWLATPTGSYQARAYSVYALDQLHSNDTVYQAFTVARHDVACTHLLAPTGGVDSNSAVTPACSLYNYGSGSENYSVRMTIGAFYNQTASVTSHASGTRIYVTFPAWSVQQARGSYQVRCSTELTTDANHANDRQTGTVQVSVHDVAAVSIQAPTGVLAPGSVIPRATVRNHGSVPETFKAFIRIIGGAGWTDSLVLTLASGRDSVLNFRNWNATPGSFATRCSTFLAADADHRNDTVSNTFLVIGHDIAAVSIEAPSGAILPGPVTPRATVHNYGSVTETFKAFVRILGGTPWTDSLTLTLASGHDSLIGFSSWLAAPGNYATRCSTFLAADDNHANDTVSNSFLVLSPDVGVTAILAPRDTVFPGIILPSATVHNYSTETESFRVFFRISGAGSYFDSVAVTLAGGRDTVLSFAGWSVTPGTYATRCSTGLAIDVNHANDVLAGSFVVRPLILAGWTRMANVLQNPKHKNVKDGGALAYATQTGNDSGFVFAFKGNNTYEFYRYNVVNEGWLTRDSIPAYNRNMKKKAVKKGSSLVMGGNGRLYATKGNNTYDYWEYAPGSGGLAGVWTQKADVPPGTKAMREGAGAVAVQSAGLDTNYIYLLKGSGTYEFYRYSVEGNTWATLASAPAGASGKSFKNGSALTYDGGDTIFCVKGSYNEFFAYSISGRNWTTRETLPRIAPPGSRKTKVKDGSGLAYDRRVIYALKGGNTNEFWTYDCNARHWYVADPMPTFSKKVKGGGALTFGSGRCWAFRGNNTLEFWQYKSPLGDLMPLAQSPQGEGAQSSSATRSLQFALSVSPNPFTASLPLSISYSLPIPGEVSLKLYDVTGKLVTTLASGHHPAGSYSYSLLTTHYSLVSGIYLLKYEAAGERTTQKLIVE